MPQSSYQFCLEAQYNLGMVHHGLLFNRIEAVHMSAGKLFSLTILSNLSNKNNLKF